MEIKKNRQCLFPLCQKQSSYNFEGEKARLYCSSHKKVNMVDVINITCLEPECEVKSSYNFIGKRAIYCTVHKKDNMVDVKNRTCLEQECDAQPCFNFKEEKLGIYCDVHKKDKMVDVKNKTCINVDCDTRACYNYKNEKTAIYCLLHKKEDMVDIKNKTCASPFCEVRFTNRKYKGLCTRCFILTYPDEPNARNYKTKEIATCDYILQIFPNFTFLTDRRIPDGCSLRRPDMFLEMGDKVIVVEIDEHQHRDYETTCENKRLMEISQDLYHRNLVMIRFNPDEYKNENGKRIQSCWSANNLGISVVTKIKLGEWQERLKVLEEEIKSWVDKSAEDMKMIELVYLFYDK